MDYSDACCCCVFKHTGCWNSLHRKHTGYGSLHLLLEKDCITLKSFPKSPSDGTKYAYMNFPFTPWSPIQKTISLSRYLFRVLIKLYMSFKGNTNVLFFLCNFSLQYLILKAFQFILLVPKHKNQFWLKALQSYIALLNTFWSLEGLLIVKFLSNFLQH